MNEVAAAIENALSSNIASEATVGRPARRHSFEKVRRLMLAVVQELPEEMTVRELRDGLSEGEPRDA